MFNFVWNVLFSLLFVCLHCCRHGEMKFIIITASHKCTVIYNLLLVCSLVRQWLLCYCLLILHLDHTWLLPQMAERSIKLVSVLIERFSNFCRTVIWHWHMMCASMLQQQEKAALMLLGRMQNHEAINVSNSQQKTYDTAMAVFFTVYAYLRLSLLTNRACCYFWLLFNWPSFPEFLRIMLPLQ